MSLILIVLSFIVIINLLSFIVNKRKHFAEISRIAPYGKLIEVNGKKMHVHAMGQGEKTIVLLPGMGLPLPSAEFAPLMRELSTKYTVASVDYFGYGFSETTTTARTSANYVEEIRQALKNYGLKPPYILMPHSASGIYSEYYATKYPDEVASIVMLDTTSSAELDKGTGKLPKFVQAIIKADQAIGLKRWYNPLIAKYALKMTRKNGYTQKEISDYYKFSINGQNENTFDQLAHFGKDVSELMTMDFPNTIPVLKFCANKSKAKWIEPYQNKHLAKLGSHAEFVNLEANHMMYFTHAKDIAEMTDEFIQKIEIIAI